MTEEFVFSKTSVFDPKSPPEFHFRPQNATLRQNRAGYKRHITHRWCARLASSGLAGADLAVEYLYGKYIKNLSVSSIEQSGRIILYYLGFIERQGATIYIMTRQDISTFVQYELDREQKPASVVNYLRAIYAFLVFLVDSKIEDCQG